MAVASRRYGRLPGRFAWGDDGAFGLSVCRAVGSEAALGALVAPLFGVGLFGVDRAERSAALASLPAAYAEPTRDAFARARNRSDLSEVRGATEKFASACLRAAIECRADARQRACAALARATGGHWCDELAALNHGRATHPGPAADPGELDALFALWVDWFAPTETERT
ncbi:MAG: hypothetical protein H6698_02605 [Myxococcales bacterium]|nr:hypothetical protein [Myxococcales bacterium]MCB9519889.1 hypothetical protein [Myxococcales bacterium]MCB9533204.1 hypothetical protein [Myxococcales bacterium]